MNRRIKNPGRNCMNMVVTAEYWTLVSIDTCKPVLNSWVNKHIYPGGNRRVVGPGGNIYR
jgi:hypothetical protein